MDEQNARERWEYRAVLAVDIEKSSGRGNVALVANRRTLRSSLRTACERAGVDWDACARADLGDGLRLVAPAGTRKARLVHPLVHELAGLLTLHNTAAPADATRIRVRVALHAGEVCLTPGAEAAGSPLETLARLLDAPAARTALTAAPRQVPLSLLMSQHFYEETVRQGYDGIDPARFHEVDVAVKEFSGRAWLHLPGWTPASPEPAPEPVRGPATMINKASRNGVIYANHTGDQHINITHSR